MDLLAWNALVKPHIDQLKPGECSQEELERLFAEEALALLENDGAVAELAEGLTLDPNAKVNLHMVRAMVLRWRKTRLVEKDYQRELLTILDGGSWFPLILNKGLIDQDWLE